MQIYENLECINIVFTTCVGFLKTLMDLMHWLVQIFVSMQARYCIEV